MIKPSVSETKWSSLLARTRALILYISIWIFDFGPEKLPGLSRNGPLALVLTDQQANESEKNTVQYELYTCTIEPPSATTSLDTKIFPESFIIETSGKRSSVLEFFIVFDLFQATFRYNGLMPDLCVNSTYFATQSMKRSLRNNIDIHISLKNCMQIKASLQCDLLQFDSRRRPLTLRILGGRLREVLTIF